MYVRDTWNTLQQPDNSYLQKTNLNQTQAGLSEWGCIDGVKER